MSVSRRSIRPSTVIFLQIKALAQAVISASRARALLPAISTPATSVGQPAARCSRHSRASCIWARPLVVVVLGRAPFLPRPLARRQKPARRLSHPQAISGGHRQQLRPTDHVTLDIVHTHTARRLEPGLVLDLLGNHLE